MNLSPGSRLGPYEIVAPVGAGGMGEVYRGRDTRLDREVAIKVLPPRLSSNPDLKQRFEREARAISAFNHPNICTLHDVGHENGADFLVMEYCDGETLAQRLGRGALPVEQVLRYGVEIADALDKAHRKGIIHRDLKPGNIMLTKSGAKLLDFGLAKYQQQVQPEIGLSALPTDQRPLTAEGTILGTFQYMAPEQLEGHEADPRTDIFALGTVLFEMATGKRAFEGKSKASLIASIIERDPPAISSIQPMTPPAFDRVVKTCLAKDPDERWQTAYDVMVQLKWIAEAGSLAGVAAPVIIRRKQREGLAWALAAMTTVAAIASLVLWQRSANQPVRRVETSIVPPEKVQFYFDTAPMALSPDGTQIAFSGIGPDGRRMLYARSLSSSHTQALAEGGNFPFWSADSRQIGYFYQSNLRKIAASGGPSQVVAPVLGARGGSWNRDGVIIFAPNPRDVIYQVPSAGGPPKPVTKLDESRGEISHRFPSFLPDGRHFLYLAQSSGTPTAVNDAIMLGSLDSEERVELLQANSPAVYAPPGYLIFSREGSLMAQRFDAGKRKLTGDPFPIAQQVTYVSSDSAAIFSVSQTGMLAYQVGSGLGMSRLTWFDRSGKVLEALEPAADYRNPRLSRDGRRICVQQLDATSGNADLWIYDLARRVPTRFTFDQADETSPVWSPDDSRLAFGSNREGLADLYVKLSSGLVDEEPIWVEPKSVKIVSDWSADGRFLIVQVLPNQAKRSWDIWTYSVEDRKATPFIQSAFVDAAARFSPDGKWVVYSSNESGVSQIYVQSFPNPAGKWMISTNGGGSPVWSRDGKEIFFVTPAPERKLAVVEVRTTPTFEAGIPQQLFPLQVKSSAPERPYDVAPDGQRILVNTAAAPEVTNPITVIQNWAAELTR